MGIISDNFIHHILCLLRIFFALSPLTDALSSLEEARVVRLLERLACLGNEGRGPVDTLLAAGYVLG